MSSKEQFPKNWLHHTDSNFYFAQEGREGKSLKKFVKTNFHIFYTNNRYYLAKRHVVCVKSALGRVDFLIRLHLP